MEADASERSKINATIQLENRIAQADAEARLATQMQRVEDGYDTVVGLTQDALAISREQNVTAIEGFRTATAEWLKGFARQSALRGGAALAMAIGNQFFNPKGAADKFVEAGQHFALAAAAGGGGAALGGGGGGGGGATGGGSRTVPSARGPETGVTDTGSGEGGGTIVVNLNAPISDKNLGRDIAASERAARRAYGRSQSARSRRR